MARTNRDHIYMYFEHGLDITSKTIYMGYGDPDSDTELDHILAANVIKSLHILSHIRPDDPITILINCQGGDTQHGLAILDTIRHLTTPVHCTVVGHCYSMAAWVLQGGRRRSMTRNSSIMIHDGEGEKSRFFREMDVRCRDILLARIREKHPRYQAVSLQKLLDTDTYMWPEQALELGLIDAIID